MQHFGLCVTALIALLTPTRSPAAQAPATDLAAFDHYRISVGARINAAHSTPAYIATPADILARAQQGEIVLEQLTPLQPLPGMKGTMLHHWRGTAFYPRSSARSFQDLLQDYAAYPRLFAPQVLRASSVRSTPGHTLATLRIRQQHVFTVVMDQTYDVVGNGDASHGWSTSTSTRIAEIASPGTSSEHPLSPADEHGFLYAQVTFWSWTEVSGGLLVQLETLSLTRDVPHGLGWAVKPYLTTVPRETLSFTLRSVANALGR